ncbi:MAG: hypothetical protein GEU91_08780 [Rhizobiales bacterium]|nr:hypothetical protein [Hyphomicrobiales bacterium]
MLDAVDQRLADQSKVRDEIARLEARIEALAESLERCRTISLMARLILAAGTVWIVLMLTRAIPFAPFNIVGAISAGLGGIVLFGSNASTWKQTEAAIAEAEALRGELIDRIALKTAEE